MSPFRQAPQVELGPLDVGLGKVASRAMVGLPRGGRVVSARPRVASHVSGAIGSTGLVFVAGAMFVACTSRWVPTSPEELLLCLLGLVSGGLSLAAVFRATDRASAPRLTRSGEEIGRGARLILRRMARLATQAERSPDAFGPRRVAALRRALLAADEPEISPWIPADVRGRGELLLARAETRLSGPSWAREEARRRHIRELLLTAKESLADPGPAEADLAAIDHAPSPAQAARR